MARWHKTKIEPQSSPPTPEPVAPPRTESQVIGRRMTIKGHITGRTELRIDGIVEGSIRLDEGKLIIGTPGRVTADVHARAVVVRGEVLGNITASDRVEVAPRAVVLGDIRAPRVVLADGSSFHGSINREPRAVTPAPTKHEGNVRVSERRLTKIDPRAAMWLLMEA